ncbi:MAG: hypothetical protein QM783_17910 [Phycisphaerales bacterium]
MFIHALTVAFLCLATAAQPQAPDKPAAPMPAAEPGKPAQAKQVAAAPRFAKGQHVVLTQYLTQPSAGKEREFPSRIDIDVTDADAKQFTLVWAISMGDKPQGLTDDEWKAVKEMMGDDTNTKLALTVDHNTAEVHLLEWEKSRDELLAKTERLMRKTRKDITEEGLAKAMEYMRSSMATREGTEAVALKQIAPYFTGLGSGLAIGDEQTVQFDQPFASRPPRNVPCTVTVRVTAAAPGPGIPDNAVRVEASSSIDRKKGAEVLQEIVRDIQKRLRPDDKPFAVEDLDLTERLDTIFDPARGWPVTVRSEQSVRSGAAKAKVTKIRWVLTEGPVSGATK